MSKISKFSMVNKTTLFTIISVLKIGFLKKKNNIYRKSMMQNEIKATMGLMYVKNSQINSIFNFKTVLKGHL